MQRKLLNKEKGNPRLSHSLLFTQFWEIQSHLNHLCFSRKVHAIESREENLLIINLGIFIISASFFHIRLSLSILFFFEFILGLLLFLDTASDFSEGNTYPLIPQEKMIHKLCLLVLRFPDKTQISIKSKFQIKSEYSFSIGMFHAVFGTYLHFLNICCLSVIQI